MKTAASRAYYSPAAGNGWFLLFSLSYFRQKNTGLRKKSLNWHKFYPGRELHGGAKKTVALGRGTGTVDFAVADRRLWIAFFRRGAAGEEPPKIHRHLCGALDTVTTLTAWCGEESLFQEAAALAEKELNRLSPSMTGTIPVPPCPGSTARREKPSLSPMNFPACWRTA